jgi:hypothetical protein
MAAAKCRVVQTTASSFIHDVLKDSIHSYQVGTMAQCGSKFIQSTTRKKSTLCFSFANAANLYLSPFSNAFDSATDIVQSKRFLTNLSQILQHFNHCNEKKLELQTQSS